MSHRDEIDELLAEARDYLNGNVSHHSRSETDEQSMANDALDTGEVVRRCELIRALVAIEMLDAEAIDTVDVAALADFVQACTLEGTGTENDPIHAEGPADARWERARKAAGA